jgi:cytochrome bd-type quinol oxidase subunit 2
MLVRGSLAPHVSGNHIRSHADVQPQNLTCQLQTRESEKTGMQIGSPERATRKHIVMCLLLLVALFGMSIAAAAHTHQKADIHEGQCAVCMSCAQMVAVCAVVVVGLLSLASETEAPVFAREPQRPAIWIPPSQRVRPPPIV